MHADGMYVELSTLTVFLRIVLRMNSRMKREQVKLMWTIKLIIRLVLQRITNDQ